MARFGSGYSLGLEWDLEEACMICILLGGMFSCCLLLKLGAVERVGTSVT